MKSMVPGVLILKYMVQGYLFRSIWYMGTYREVYCTGILIMEYMVPGYIF